MNILNRLARFRSASGFPLEARRMEFRNFFRSSFQEYFGLFLEENSLHRRSKVYRLMKILKKNKQVHYLKPFALLTATSVLAMLWLPGGQL